MLINVLLLIIGFVLMIRGADAFVDGAVSVARRFHISEIVIGLTIVAMGTSAPEAAVSISSVFYGADGVAVGNVLGSNIANILLVLGVTGAFYGLSVQKNTIRYEIPFVGFITLLLMWFGANGGVITRVNSFVLVGLFLLFLVYTFITSHDNQPDLPKPTNMSGIKTVIFLVFGIIALVFGSNLTVNNAVEIARALNISERVIGLTLVAIGTSLPELVTCIIAAHKHSSDLAVGNIIGSNIFNILFVLGITGIIRPIPFQMEFLTDSAIAIITTVLLWLFVIYQHKLSRGTGWFFLLCYTGYVMYLIK